jgi:hypothetical protein
VLPILLSLFKDLIEVGNCYYCFSIGSKRLKERGTKTALSSIFQLTLDRTINFHGLEYNYSWQDK